MRARREIVNETEIIMAQGHHADPYEQKHRSGTAYAPAPKRDEKQEPRPCGCGEPESTSTCCDTECFERPQYFCGHLLTDADLSLQQRYVIGKHKLYHRALHGSGIVCGLRLTCHPECDGYVIAGEGFAIDDCGNDLVVCEPMPFDVIGAARRKKLLYPAPPRPDDCKPGEEYTDCVLRQCLYIVACYEERPGEYATPLASSCGPSKGCEPTRIRETVRLDVVDKLPRGHDPLGDLEWRIKRCFALFTDGPFADLLNKGIVPEALAGTATPNRHDEWCNLICGLRILFKRYLECHPDHYNCTLEQDLNAICCPPDPRKPSKPPQDYPPKDQNQQGQPPDYGAAKSRTSQPVQTAQALATPTEGTPPPNYGPDIRDAVCRIVELAYSHVMACVMGELAFACPEPPHASCVVLGTVEVENERLIRVCNCPRDYVWSFGSFWPVLMATLFGSLGCRDSDDGGTHSHDRATGQPGADIPHSRVDDLARKYRRCGCADALGEKPCCREFEPRDGCEAFIRTLQQGGRAAPDLATSLLDAIGWIRCSVQHAFDPTRTDAMLLRALRGRQFTDVRSNIFTEEMKVVERPVSMKCEPWGLIDALDMAGHVTAANRLVALTDQGVVVDVVKQGVQDRLTTTENEVEKVQQQLIAVQAELDKVKAMLSQYGPPSGGGQQGPVSRGSGGRGGRRGGPGGSTGGGTQP